MSGRPAGGSGDHDDGLRRRIAAEAARGVAAGSDAKRAVFRAARRLSRGWVPPDRLPSVDEVRARVDVPVVFFATEVAGLFPLLSRLAVHGFGVDWRLTLPQARALLGRDVTLQGNLDPQILAGPWEYVEQSARAILKEAADLPAYVFNLGHGVLPHTPPENVQRLVELVQAR